MIDQLVDLMLGKIFTTKYIDAQIPLVNVHINNNMIPSTLINLGATINFMIKETIEQLRLPNLCHTPIIPQLANQSTIKPKGILEDVLVSMVSYE